MFVCVFFFFGRRLILKARMGGLASKGARIEDLEGDLLSRAFAITGGQVSRKPSLPPSVSSAVEEDFPFLIQALSKLLIFGNLSPEKQATLCSNMYVIDIPAGEILIREGEEGVAASELYVVRSGDFEVLQKHRDVNVRVNRKQAGDIFGEVALLYSVPRNATVVALTDSSVFVLPRNVFNYYIRENPNNEQVDERQRIHLDIFLNSVHVIQPLNKEERSELIENLTEEHFEPGEVISRKGDAANKFYIIMKGEVTISDEQSGVEEILTELYPGEFFGEESLAPPSSFDDKVGVSNQSNVVDGLSVNMNAKASDTSPGGTTCLTIVMEKADVLRPLYEMMLREKNPFLMKNKWESMKSPSKDVPCPILIKEINSEGKSVIVSRCRGHLYETSRLRDSKSSVLKKITKEKEKDRFKRNSINEGYISSFNAYRRRSSSKSEASNGSSDSNVTEDLGSLLTDSFYKSVNDSFTKSSFTKLEQLQSQDPMPSESEGDGFNAPSNNSGTKATDKPGTPRPELSSPSALIQNASEEDVQDFGLVLFKGGVLGSGAFSVVYVVHEERSKRKFAMKRIPKSVVENCRSHILCEQKITRMITHPYVIRQYASFQDKKYLYFLFDYLPCGDLMDVLCGEAKLIKATTDVPCLTPCLGSFGITLNRFSGNGSNGGNSQDNGRYLVGLEERLAKFYVAQIILVLEHLHKMGIVYRDLKPENVLVDDKGYIKLGDFGFSKNLKNLKNEQTFTFCGTPGFVAPENVFTQGYSYSVDFWSLGVLTYVLLTGKQPFNQPKTSDPMVVVRRIVDSNWAITYPPYMKPVAKEFIEQLLQREWQNRLGCRAGGFKEIKQHKWFKDMNWELLEVKKLKPHRMPIISKRKRRASSGLENSPESNPNYSFDSETKNFFEVF